MTLKEENRLIREVTELHTLVTGNGLIKSVRDTVSRLERLEEDVVRGRLLEKRWRDFGILGGGVVLGSLLSRGIVRIADIVGVLG